LKRLIFKGSLTWRKTSGDGLSEAINLVRVKPAKIGLPHQALGGGTLDPAEQSLGWGQV
jgi:hypothetical protein